MSDIQKSKTTPKHSTNQLDADQCRIFSFYTKREMDLSQSTQIIAMYPELTGTKMLYKNRDQADRCIAVPVLFWALQAGGHIVGLVPWLDQIVDCGTIADRFDISWEGYYNESAGSMGHEAPAEIAQLLTLQQRFSTPIQAPTAADQPAKVLLELSDPVGTHAMLMDEENESLTLTAVVSWQLLDTGEVFGMLADESLPHKYPILAKDHCLYRADQNRTFRCYFQRDIAEQIRARDPETLEAIEKMFL